MTRIDSVARMHYIYTHEHSNEFPLVNYSPAAAGENLSTPRNPQVGCDRDGNSGTGEEAQTLDMRCDVGTKVTALSNVSNDAKLDVEILTPYMVEARIEGTSAMLFHRWSCEAVEEKAKAAKGSKSKKTDNIESYIYRDEKGDVAVPSEYFRQAIIHAAKFKQDPRSPRKSAMDLFKAGIATIGELCSLGVKEPDYLDRRRVVIQRNGITRVRPAMLAGWTCKVCLQILLPEYISPQMMNDTLQYAGRIVGVGDFRPSFGRFQVTAFDVIELR